MSRHYLFARAWIGFSPSFPFHRFNGLPDDETEAALEAHSIEWFRSNKQQLIERIRRQRACFIYSHLIESLKDQRDRGVIPRAGTAKLHKYAAKVLRGEPIPWAEDKTFYDPEDLVRHARTAWKNRWAVDGFPRKPSLGFRIACSAGWITYQRHANSFGGWSPSGMLLLAEVPDSETASQLVEELQNGNHVDELVETIHFWNLRFGHCPADQVSAALRERFRSILGGWRSERPNALDMTITEKVLPVAQRLAETLLNEAETCQSEKEEKPTGGRRPKGKAVLTAAAKKEFVLNFVKEQRWEGTLDELRKELAKKGKGLNLSRPTLSRYLKGTKYVASGPHRTVRNPRAGRIEREAVSADQPADMSGLDAWTMPDDDDDDSVS